MQACKGLIFPDIVNIFSQFIYSPVYLFSVQFLQGQEIIPMVGNLLEREKMLRYIERK